MRFVGNLLKASASTRIASAKVRKQLSAATMWSVMQHPRSLPIIEPTDAPEEPAELPTDASVLNSSVGDYFYIDDVLQKAYQLLEFEGNYYLVAEKHKICKNDTRKIQAAWVGNTSITPGTYTFDADGKMILE